jgi:heme/copper-type cytochrome/quinol oxidase subunit 3
MIRPILLELALFLAPFAAYAVFLVATKAAVLERDSWPVKTVLTLAIVAFVLMIGSFLYLAHFSGAPPGVDYIPAHFDKDGNFVPGQLK